MVGPREVFTRECPGDITYTSTTYYATDFFPGVPETPYVNSEGAMVDFVTPEKLVAGPFGEYNRRLFEHVGVKHSF